MPYRTPEEQRWKRARRLPSLAACAFALLALGPARGQTAPPAAAPPHPREALAFFQGTWTTSDSTPEDGFREVCAWLGEARSHMVCRARWRTTRGPAESLSIFSHDAASGDYLYHGFRASGSVVPLRGRLRDGVWIFLDERGQGSARTRSRISLVPTPDTEFDFLSESATGDGPWELKAKVRYLRLPP